MHNTILSLNAGSSSLKFALFEATKLRVLMRGSVDTVGTASCFRARDGEGNVLANDNLLGPHQEIVGTLLAWLDRHLGANMVIAAGHRVVHGGRDHYAPEVVTPALIAALEGLVPLAPLHQLHDLVPMKVLGVARPGLPQVACFDTAFHKDMRPVTTRFALPHNYEKEGIRRYGFHGLSYEYIAGKLAELAPEVANKKIIVAHLGNGASLCAMEAGRSVDTSMGMTPLDGLVMGTRCGSIDPGVVLHLLRERGMAVEAVEDLLYRRSGLLGVSGTSSDMSVLLKSKETRACEAVELFVFRVTREIAALAATLGGLDALVFTAGIGEHAPEIRRRICEKTAWLGLELDSEANHTGSLRVSLPDSRVAAFIVPTDEEWVIASHTRDLLAKKAGTK